jgi:hypothetical protein
MKKILLIVLVGTFFAAGAAYAGCGSCGPKDGAEKAKCTENCEKACCAEAKKCCGEGGECCAEKAKKCPEGCTKPCCDKKAKCGDDCTKPCCAKEDATASTKEAIAPCCAQMLGDKA